MPRKVKVKYKHGAGLEECELLFDAAVMAGASAEAAGKAGLVPAPAKGAATRYLCSDGTWQVPPDNNTTYGAATQSANGLMTAADKKKLDGIAAGAQVNPVASSAAPKAHGTAGVGTSLKYAREDHVHPSQTGTVFISGTRTSVIAANTAFTVPSYVVGSGRLQVYLDGLLCAGGSDATNCAYVEVGTVGAASTSIQFHQSIPVDMEIIARVQ